jgi:hypothetical protein
MERDEAVGALRDLFEARDKMRNLIQGGYDDYAKEAEEAFVEIRERILAALTGSDRPEVDLRKEIMNIPVNSEMFAKAVRESLAPSLSGTVLYKLGHRDARHAAAEIVAGTWRKVTP